MPRKNRHEKNVPKHKKCSGTFSFIVREILIYLAPSQPPCPCAAAARGRARHRRHNKHAGFSAESGNGHDLWGSCPFFMAFHLKSQRTIHAACRPEHGCRRQLRGRFCQGSLPPVQDGSTERGWALWQNHVSVFFALEPFGESVVLLSCDGAVHAGQKNAFSGAEDSLL